MTSHDGCWIDNEILNNTRILVTYNNKQQLTIAEALLIKDKKPVLNLQREGEQRVLQIFQ